MTITVEWWHFAIMVLFVVACVMYNHAAGLKQGVQLTLELFVDMGVISLVERDGEQHIVLNTRETKDEIV